ncbi:TPA: ClbS/DfsB family four-helix bundle protein [Pseudomonas aeruginosa]|uniref:ClbS/DfsB family four-helix bundle protein n=1 Tax=Pseudomonas aeruginosa TaxID=287 RepID=UPI000B33BEA5|nr:ClbS/DfsB family four-helix bundle protein [Pseudomonas aeruginosa]
MAAPQNKQELLDAIHNTYKKLIVDLAEVSTEHDRIVALVEQERYSSLYGMP